jgi:conjugal transfer pilus assembly protein TraV
LAEEIDVRAAFFFLLGALGGCTSLSGFDASDKFSCSAPDGVMCSSMSGIYENAQQHNLPSMNVRHVSIHARDRAKPHGRGYASPVPDYPPEGGGFQPESVFDEGQGSSEATEELSRAKVDNIAVLPAPPNSGAPIRSAPRVLRALFFPWEDTDGDLHDGSYVYLTVDTGHWLIEHNRKRIRDTFAPVLPAPGAAMSTSTAPAVPSSDVPTGPVSPLIGATSVPGELTAPTASTSTSMGTPNVAAQ